MCDPLSPPYFLMGDLKLSCVIGPYVADFPQQNSSVSAINSNTSSNEVRRVIAEKIPLLQTQTTAPPSLPSLPSLPPFPSSLPLSALSSAEDFFYSPQKSLRRPLLELGAQGGEFEIFTSHPIGAAGFLTAIRVVTWQPEQELLPLSPLGTEALNGH